MFRVYGELRFKNLYYDTGKLQRKKNLLFFVDYLFERCFLFQDVNTLSQKVDRFSNENSFFLFRVSFLRREEHNFRLK